MKKDRIPDFVLERLALGELAPGEAARVRAELGEEADARLAALADDDAEILAATPPSAVAAEVRRRLARERPSPAMRWWIPVGGALAAAGLALFFARTAVPPEGHGDEGPSPAVDDGSGLPEVTRIKGDAVLTIERLGERGPERVHDGDVAHAGDRVQLQYRAADREQGAIVSIDGRGVATLHFPADVHASPMLAGGGTIALDHSYELDDAPGFERFFFVTAAPGLRVRVDEVMKAAESLARSPGAATDALALPNGYEQSSLSLRKPDTR